MSHSLPSSLVLDEMADLALYRNYHQLVRHPELVRVFSQLIEAEEGHVAFWKKRTGLHPARLDRVRAAKIWSLTLFGRVFGVSGILLVLEAIEVHGIRKYVSLWESLPEGDLRDGVRLILEDELKHEDRIVTAVTGRGVSPEQIRNAFLGFNDGSVEILGAVSGFAAAFNSGPSVLVAGTTVAVAGALSMAVGAFMATSAEREVSALDDGRRRVLGETVDADGRVKSSPLSAALLVGSTYLVGALVPVAPFLFGAQTALPSIAVSGVLILCVSATLAFLSGMHIARRLLLNGTLIAFAVAVSTLLGIAFNYWR